MIDVRQFVVEQMANTGLTGLTSVELVADGSLHRFRPDWEPVKSKKRAWYVVYPFRLDNGATMAAGAFGWFVGAESFEFSLDVKAGVSLSQADRVRFDREQAEKRLMADQQHQAQSQQAADKALKIWASCNTEGHSKYAQRKRIACLGVRFSRGSLVLPVLDLDGKLHGLQFIAADGNKRFLTGTAKKGRCCPIGEVIDPTGFVGVAEGYATAISCHMAGQMPVFVAFDAGNLEPVALAIRTKHPQAKIIIFGDDDLGNPQNPGRAKAIAAACAVGGRAVFPPREVVA